MVKPQADNPSVPDGAPTLVSDTLPATTVSGDAGTIQDHRSDASGIHLSGGMAKQAEPFRAQAPAEAAAREISPNPSVPPRPNVHGGD